MSGYPPGWDADDAAPWNAEDADQEAIDEAKAEFYVENREKARQAALAEDLVEAIAQDADHVARGYRDALINRAAGVESIECPHLRSTSEVLEPYVQRYLKDWWEVEERERFGAERLVR